MPCKEKILKMSKYLENVHICEFDVQRVLMYPKESQERRKAWGMLLNEGDFEHSVEVVRAGNIQNIIPKYR